MMPKLKTRLYPTLVLLSILCPLGLCLSSTLSITNERRSMHDDYNKLQITPENYGTITSTSESHNPFRSKLTAKYFRRGISCCGVIGGHTNQTSNQGKRNDWNLSMAITLFATYFTLMAAKCALPSTMSLLVAEESGLKILANDAQPQQIMATVLSCSTFAIVGGKFLLGPVIDRFGGVFCLKVALSSLLTVLGVIATTTTFRVFAVGLVIIDFIFSSCWAACLNAVHYCFAKQHWAGQISLLVSYQINCGYTRFHCTRCFQLTEACKKRLWRQEPVTLCRSCRFRTFCN